METLFSHPTHMLRITVFHNAFMLAKSLHSCLNLWDSMDCRLPGSSVHGILQARILERVVIPFSRGSSWPRDQTLSPVAPNCRQILYCWDTRESPSIGYFRTVFKNLESVQFSSVQSLSCVWLYVTPWTAACQASLFISNPQRLLKLMSLELVMSSNHLILFHPLPLPPSIFPNIRAFSNDSVLHIRWPKYWSLSFSISPSNEYSGLISFMMDWLDLFAVQGTLKSLLQHHSSKASILWLSAFFIVQLSHPYMTTGKTIAWTTWTNASVF